MKRGGGPKSTRDSNMGSQRLLEPNPNALAKPSVRGAGADRGGAGRHPNQRAKACIEHWPDRKG